MVRHLLRPWLTPLLMLLCTAVAWVSPLPIQGAEPSAPKKKPLIYEPVNEQQALADRIDKLIAAEWAKRGITPAEPASDAEFLRRVCLDIGGRIPWNSQVRAFLDNPSPDKRDRKIDDLLANARYSSNFTSVWRTLLLPQNNNQFGQNFAVQLDPWLRQKMTDNTRYDQLVREILTVQLGGNDNMGLDRQEPRAVNYNAPSPRVYYQANESKPENLAASTSRLFLGVRLECAQCHDHPFAKWTRDDFWQYAAFFSGISPQQRDGGFYSVTLDQSELREIKIPGKDRYVKARFLDRTEPKWQDGVSTRTILANWMTSRENPYFARAAVNRVWAHFFGIGIIDPVDEPNADNPPSHPELLDELARSFIDSGFDLKFLMGAIARSKTYQLSSAISDQSEMDARMFARMSLKGLTAEQFFDSLALATGYGEKPQDTQRFGDLGTGSPRAEFLSKFTNFADKRTEFQTSILQALALMNGKLITDMTSADVSRSQVLSAIESGPFMTTEKKIEALYLTTLSRKPTEKELAKMTKYVDEGGPTKDSRKALGDVFWALLNSSEFILNH
jgi:hypothetical protein